MKRLPMIIAVLVAAASGASADAPRLDVKSSHKVVLRGEPFVVTWEMPSRDYRVISVTSLKVDGAALLRRSSELSGLEQIVIPERAGPLTIPPITYALERTADGSASSVTSPPLTISVQENADALLPASNVHLECSSSRSGDTITQSTRVTAFADLRNALPRFRQPPAVAFEESTSDQGLLDDVYGLRMLKTVTRTAKVPAAQAFVVPPIDFPFRDTTTGLPSVARCQGSVILPLEGDLRKAAADAAAAAAPQTKSESPSPVRWIFPPLLLIASIVIFTFPRKRKARVPVIATPRAKALLTRAQLRARLERVLTDAGLNALILNDDQRDRGRIFRALQEALDAGDDDSRDPAANKLYEELEAALRRSVS